MPIHLEINLFSLDKKKEKMARKNDMLKCMSNKTGFFQLIAAIGNYNCLKQENKISLIWRRR